MSVEASPSLASLSPSLPAHTLKKDSKHQDGAPKTQNGAAEMQHAGLQKPGAAHHTIRHALPKSKPAKGHTTFVSTSIVADHKRPHHGGGSRAGGMRAGKTHGQAAKHTRFSTRLVSVHEPSLITSHRVRKDSSTSETYRVASGSYRVHYVAKGAGSYAVIQPLSASHSVTQGALSRTSASSFPATLVAAIGHVLAGLARTGGGGVGVLAGLPLPVQTILFGLILSGIGVLLRGISFATAFARASSLVAEPMGAEAEVPAE